MARNAPIRNAETTPMKPLTFPSRCRIRRRRYSARIEALESRRLLSTFTVNSTADDGSTGTLRWAIGQANSAGGAETIQFNPTVFATPQTITLGGTQLELSDTTGTETITGPAAGLTISGGGQSRVFQVDGGVAASISGLTITGGNAGNGNGGGLANYGTASLSNCTVSDNSASSGGGLFLFEGATTLLTNCALSGNSALSGNTASFGGGLYSLNGTTTLTNCTISGNSAGIISGGLFFFLGTATLTDCTVGGNSAGVFGGGLSIIGDTATLTNCTVENNSAAYNGGGVYAHLSTTTLTNCTISGNSVPGGSGGGLQTGDDATTLTNCTISGNSASYSGGGSCNYGSTDTLTNCTISGNSSSGTGGGLADGRGVPNCIMVLNDCTVSGNSALGKGGGVSTLIHDTTTLGNTILAGNTGLTAPDGAGGFTSQGNNLIGETDGSSGWVSSDLTGTIANPLDPLLAPLGNFGGPTQTMALLFGSPAIDAGNNALIPAGITTDQRGIGYPRIVYGIVDIGAYEFQPIPNVVSIAIFTGAPAVAKGIPSQFTANATLADGSTLNVGNLVTWASATPSVATVSLTGLATTLAEGTSLISASLGDVVSNGVTLTVTPAVVTSIAVSPLHPIVAVGGTEQFTASGTYTDGSTADLTSSVTWASATPSVASINALGVASNVITGQSVITATLGGVTSPGDTLSVSSFVVDTAADYAVPVAGQTTLREAIALANATPGDNTITFDPTVFDTPQTITLGSTQLELSDTTGTETITGPEAGVTVSGGQQGRVFQVDGGVSATLSGLGITGGSSGGKGGGILNLGSLILTGCTLWGNTASDGGAIFTGGGSLSLVNCTVASNVATVSGGGIEAQSPVSVLSSTFADNQADKGGGGAIDNPNGGSFPITVGNTIFADDTCIYGPDVANSVISLGHNLVSRADNSSGWVASDLTGTSDQPLDARLGPLGNYGGPTQTMALLPSSPAIDAGNNALIPAGITTDQRGIGHARIIDGTVDIGSFEFVPGTDTATVSLSSNPITISDNQTVTFTAVVNGLSEPAPTGTIKFVIDGVAQPRVALVSAQAFLSETNLPAGDDEIDAFYSGDDAYAAAQATIYEPVSRTAPTIMLSSNLSYITDDQDVTFTAQVTGVSDLTPTGTITFVIDGVTQPSVGLASARAFLSETNLPNGDHEIEALYSGDANYVPAQATIHVTVKIAQPITGGIMAGTLTPGSTAFYFVNPPTDVLLNANLTATSGARAALILLDVNGTELTQSDGISTSNPADQITQNLEPGTDYLEVEGLSGSGQFVLSTSLSTASAPDQPISINSPALGVKSVTANFRKIQGLYGLDVATLNSEGDVSVSYATGNGFFGTLFVAASFQGLSPSSLVVGDFNHDGLIDLAVGTADGVEVLLNQGTTADQLFAPPVLYKTANPVTSLVVGNFFGDNNLDLAVGTYNGVEMLKGNGDGTFDASNPHTYLAGQYVVSLVAGNFITGDSNLDLAVGTSDGVQVLTGNGGGTFDTSSATYLPGEIIYAIVADDFNGDGDLDLAVGTPDGGDVLLGTGQGTFGNARPFLPGETVSSIVSSDLTGNGSADLAVLTSGGLDVLLNKGTGDGTFGTPTTYFAGAYLTSIVSGIRYVGSTLPAYNNFNSIAAATPEGGFKLLANLGNGSFSDRVYDIFSEENVTDVIAGDFNGDGNPDLAVGTRNGLELLFANGNGTFGPPVTYLAGYQITSLVAGDFEGDGHLDLAVGILTFDGSGRVEILRNNGNGAFVEGYSTPELASYVISLVAGEFNRDGRLDLAVGTFGNDIYVLLNKGGGTFSTTDMSGLPGGTSILATGDFTGDGVLDLAAATNAGVEVLLGDGDGTFKLTGGDGSDVIDGVPVVGVYLHGYGYAPTSLLAADFNDDGRLDLAVGTQYGGVAVMLGKGDGTFGPATDYDTATYVSGLAVGDFNSDGRISLAVATGGPSPSPGDLEVFPGNGDGTFGAPVVILQGESLTSLIAVDFNHDGRTDLAAGSTDVGVQVLLSNGSVSNNNVNFAITKVYPVPAPITSFVTGEFSGDGYPDLAVVEGDGLVVMAGLGDGTFGRPQEYLAGLTVYALVAGDFQRDGKYELIAATSDGIFVLSFNGDDTFGATTSYLAGQTITELVTGDFNGDGSLDLAALTSNGHVELLLNKDDGSGGFLAPIDFTTGQSVTSLVAGDFNHDGQTDLALGTSNGVEVLSGTGSGSFAEPIFYLTGTSVSSLVAGDFNGDGRTDLAALTPGGIEVLLGTGDGTFSTPETYLGGVAVTCLVAGDFNIDGRTDLAAATANGVEILLSNDDGTFGTPTTYLPGVDVSSLLASDVNGDGRPDLITGSSAGIVQVLFGQGDGTFGNQPGYAAGQSVTVVASGDFNGDGRPDLVVGTFSGIEVLTGNGDGTFSSPVRYLAGDTIYAIATGDFNDDGRTDLAVGTADGLEILLGNGDGTFASPQAYLSGETVYTIVPGDFDQKGLTDLAVGTKSGNVDVLANDGDSSFGSIVTFALGHPVLSLVAGTFVTGDTTLDLAAGTADGIEVILGGGDGRFGSPTFFSTSEHPGDSVTTLVAGNFTGAGNLDLVAGNFDGGVLFLAGNGDGTFGAAKTIQGLETVNAASIVAGDFNGGGLLDLAVGSSNGVELLTGNGAGTFTVRGQSLNQNNISSLAVADFNGDGHLDLATSDSVILGDGTGDFSAPQALAATTQSSPLVIDAAGDVAVVAQNGDILLRRAIAGEPGQFESPVVINPGVPALDITAVSNGGEPTIVAVDSQNDAISYYSGLTGKPIGMTSFPKGWIPAQVVAGDLNGNGIADLVVRNAGVGTVAVLLGQRGGGFGAPSDFPIGAGASSIALADLGDTGHLGLLVTNSVTGEVLYYPGLGDGTFAAPSLYQAGPGPYGQTTAADGSTSVASNDQTAGVAVASISRGGPSPEMDVVTINPGSNTLAVLAGTGGGGLANAQVIATTTPATIVRAADLTGNGRDDLAVLGSDGVTIYLADGDGGFVRGQTYDVGPNATGLTIADINKDGKPDLLVGNTYGDILVLLSNGDGTFKPYQNTDQAIALAVADLKDNGQQDFIYADQGLDQVSVQYSGAAPLTLAGKQQGLLAPGAVSLVYFKGNPIPDLVVANSGSNDILVYPGLSNGQFGPALNGGKGYFTGTNPVGITVADLNGDGIPDLVVANQGSNDVSIFYGKGTSANWTLTPGERLNAGPGPAATVVVPNAKGSGNPDIIVSDSLANQAVVLPGIGQGFFNDQNPQTFAVGTDPGPIFVGDFTGSKGGLDLITVNAGSNDLTLIPDFENGGIAQSIPSGGIDPVAAVSITEGEDLGLVVANRDDGAIALFLGGEGEFAISSVANVPNPTSLAVDPLTGNVYESSAGEQSALELTFSETSAGSQTAIVLASSSAATGIVDTPATTTTQQQSIQFQPVSEGSFLGLVATLTTVTVTLEQSDSESAIGATASVAASSSGAMPNQPLPRGGMTRLADEEFIPAEEFQTPHPGASDPASRPEPLSPLSRFLYGLDEALERVRQDAREAGPEARSGAGANERAIRAIDAVLSRWSPLVAKMSGPPLALVQEVVELGLHAARATDAALREIGSREVAGEPDEAALPGEPRPLASSGHNPVARIVAVTSMSLLGIYGVVGGDLQGRRKKQAKTARLDRGCRQRSPRSRFGLIWPSAIQVKTAPVSRVDGGS